MVILKAKFSSIEILSKHVKSLERPGWWVVTTRWVMYISTMDFEDVRDHIFWWELTVEIYNVCRQIWTLRCEGCLFLLTFLCVQPVEGCVHFLKLTLYHSHILICGCRLAFSSFQSFIFLLLLLLFFLVF